MLGYVRLRVPVIVKFSISEDPEYAFKSYYVYDEKHAPTSMPPRRRPAVSARAAAESIEVECSDVAQLLASSTDWDLRKEGLIRLGALCGSAADVADSRTVDAIAQAAAPLVPAVLLQLADPRSNLAVTALATITSMACGLGAALGQLAAALTFEAVLRVPLTNTVVSASAARCLASLISQIQSSSFVPRLLTNCGDRHKKLLRERAMECLLQVRKRVQPRCVTAVLIRLP